MTREEAVKWLEHMKKSYMNLDICDVFCDSLDMAIKALQEPERKKGHWNKDGECSACRLRWDHYMVNNAQDWGYFDPMPDFCPNCGADMRGEQE